MKYFGQSSEVIVKYLPVGEVTGFKIQVEVDDMKTQWSDNYAVKTIESIEINTPFNEESILEDKLSYSSGELLLYGSD